MIRLSSRLLARLAAYPEGVRDRLSQPLTPAVIRDGLRILHGEHSPPQAHIVDWLDRDEPVDAFLTRLMASPRFAERVGDVLRALKAPPPGARHHEAGTARRLAELTGEMIVPMAMGDAPYIWKLAEIAATRHAPEAGRLAPEAARDLRDLVLLWRLFHGTEGRRATGPAAPGTALAQVLRDFAADPIPEAARLLSAVLASCRADLRFRRDRVEAGADLARDTSAAFVLHLLGRGPSSRLARVDHETLRMLAGEAGSSGILTLGPPQPLAVILSDPPTPAAEAAWQARRADGSVQALRIAPDQAAAETAANAVGDEAGTLILPGNLEPSDLLCVALRVAQPLVGAEAGATARPLHVPDPAASLSWEREILGFPDRRKRTGMGQFVPACDRVRHRAEGMPPAARPLPVELRPAGAGARGGLTIAPRDIAPDQAFALVVRLDDKARPGQHLNLDNCHVTDGTGRAALEALAARVGSGAIGHRALTKPVILIGADTPPDAHHLIRATARHWAHGGRYPATGTALGYDAAEGRFDITPDGTPDTAHLTRLLLAAVTTLPLRDLPDLLAGGAFDWLARGLVVMPADRVAVCTPGALDRDDWAGAGDHRMRALRRLDLSRRPEDHFPDTDAAPTTEAQTDALRDVAARRARVTRAQGAALSGAAHWPIEPLVAETEWLHRRIEATAERFADAPDLAEARHVLDLLTRPEVELRSLGPVPGRFLTALAEWPGGLAGLSAGHARQALTLARHVPQVDAIAARLAVTAAEIVGDRDDLVLPLTDVLAIGLPPADLEAALVALAQTAPPGLRMGRRLTLAARRHAGPLAQGQLALRLARTDPALLEDGRILSQLFDLLDSPALPALSHAMGRDMGAAIRAAADPRDLFRAALAAGDRDALTALLGDAERLGALDLTVWLDALRGQSNALRDLALPVGDIVPPGGRVQRRKLMAAIFHDQTELSALQAGGFLDDGSDLSAICLNQLGDNTALNAILARHFEADDLPPLRIMGATVAEVFANAMPQTNQQAPDTATGPAPSRPAGLLGRAFGRAKPVPPEPGPSEPKLAAPAPSGRAGSRVSVAISAYDPDPVLLDLALGSMRAQRGVETEIFVIDDASGPDGRAVIDACLDRDPALTLIRLDENRGPYIGRNRVLEAMTGDVLAIQDADDWSHPDRFARQLAAMAADPDRQLVTTSHIRIDAAGQVQMEAEFAIMGDGTMTSMFRRAIFDEVGPFAAVRSRGDVEMRERLRTYCGGHALHAIRAPMVLCYGAAGTLSQRVRSGRGEALQLWRAHIDDRPSLAGMRGEGTAFDPAQSVVPWGLRPGTKGRSGGAGA